MPKRPEHSEVFRAIDSALLPGPEMRHIQQGNDYLGSDPAVRAYPSLFRPLSDVLVEQATQAPGELRAVNIPTPTAPAQARQAQGDPMPHVHPPEHPDSPASTFAPFQPAASVVADDVAEKGQAGDGNISASEATDKFKDQTLDTSGGHTGEASATGELNDPVNLGDDTGDVKPPTKRKGK